MRDYNKVILMGNLAQDPIYKDLSSTNKVCNFVIAANRTWKGPEGEDASEVSYIDCMVFGARARTVADHFHKGRPIFVEGRLKQEKWTDKDTGKKQSRLRVVVENFNFIDKKSDTAPQPVAACAGTGGCDSATVSDDFDALG